MSKGAYSSSNSANGVVEKMHVEQDGMITTISKENGKTRMNVSDLKNNPKIIESQNENMEKTVHSQVQEIKTKNKIIKINQDGTREEIIDRKHHFSNRHYIEKNLYNKNGQCTSTTLEGVNGIFNSTVVERDKWGNGIYKTEGHLNSNPNNTKRTFVFRQDRDAKELVEASVTSLDGSNYTIALEKNKYGFETGYYILTKISKAGKKQTSRIHPNEIKMDPGRKNLDSSSIRIYWEEPRILESGYYDFKDTCFFKIGDCEFLTDIGIKNLVL